ncbi:MAG: MarR family transcriptional regulator [Clostridium sp.]|nr:MarR family transcriptional regulator [Clostridium sp.]
MIDRFERFTLSIFTITRYWNKIATEEMKKHGLKGAYALYLVTLADAEKELTAAQLADLTQRDKADISRAVASLQERGILEPYSGSRYRAPIRLTEAGKALADEIREKAGVVLQAAGAGLSEEMRGSMYRALDIIAGNMKEICEGDISL